MTVKKVKYEYVDRWIWYTEMIMDIKGQCRVSICAASNISEEDLKGVVAKALSTGKVPYESKGRKTVFELASTDVEYL